MTTRHPTRRWTNAITLLAAAGLLAAACGGGNGDSSESTGAATGGPATTDAPTAPTGDPSPATTIGDTKTSVVEDDTQTDDKYGGDLIVGIEAELVGMRPWEDTCGQPCYDVMGAIFDPLAVPNVDGDYEPALAESIEPNEDFTVWAVTLRPDVTFSNGTPVTAQTLADMFPIQAAGSAGSGAVASSNLTGVEATGELEATYTLSMPNSAFTAYLARTPLGYVFDPAAAAADPEGFSTSPVGSGPFTVAKRDLDNETVVVRNPNYWRVNPDGDQLPYLDSITFRPIPDEGTRLDALLAGDLDAMHSLRQGTIRDARAAKDGGAAITLIEHQGNNVGGGMYNMLVAPFDDLRVRKGLTLLNSQEKVIEALGGSGISQPGTQWFSPASRWYSEKAAAAWPTFDFEGGKALIEEYVNDPARSDGKAVGEPIDVELSCPPDPTLIAAMQVLDQTWSATELINVKLTNFDQQTHINRAVGAENGFVGTHQAHCWRFSSQDDPSVDLNPSLAPPTAEIAEAAGLPGVVSPFNFANWFNPDAFMASQAAIRTDDFDQRFALYEQISLAIATDFPYWYSGHTATMFAVKDTVKGLNSWHTPSGTLGFGMHDGVTSFVETFMVK